MFSKRREKYAVVALVFIVVYAEFMVYLIQPLFWDPVTCAEADETCIRILLVADPQIQGEQALAFPLNYIFFWDSDRYLHKTFHHVLYFVRPHMIIFLGDLMDEGSIATDIQFTNYVSRLRNIFEIPYTLNVNRKIYIPGDNDIGGENERVRYDRLKEFLHEYGDNDVEEFKGITIFKVNKITRAMPDTRHNEPNEENFNIVISHMPILGTIFSGNVIKKLYPKVIFSAHDHSAKYMYVAKDENLSTVTRRDVKGKEKINLQFYYDKLVHEFVVPTCSYRMGTRKIGYGAAVIGRDNQLLTYQILWSSERFPFLIVYAVVVSSLLLYFFTTRFLKCVKVTYCLMIRKFRGKYLSSPGG